MGVGLSLLNLAGNGASDRHLQMRPELELNPKFNFTPNLRMDLRNRLEWRWNEEEAFTTHRSRHRIQFGWTLPQAIGPWTRVFASNEWLIDLHRQTWAENRCIPLGLTFKSASNTEMDFFYMILSTRPHQEWLHESVLGTYLKVKF